MLSPIRTVKGRMISDLEGSRRSEIAVSQMNKHRSITLPDILARAAQEFDHVGKKAYSTIHSAVTAKMAAKKRHET